MTNAMLGHVRFGSPRSEAVSPAYTARPAVSTSGSCLAVATSSAASYDAQRGCVSSLTVSTSGGQRLSIRSLGSEYVSRRSKALDACRPSDQAAIAIPPARPATRARNSVARHPRRNSSPTCILTTSTLVGPPPAWCDRYRIESTDGDRRGTASSHPTRGVATTTPFTRGFDAPEDFACRTRGTRTPRMPRSSSVRGGRRGWLRDLSSRRAVDADEVDVAANRFEARGAPAARPPPAPDRPRARSTRGR